ncbi:MAG: hypothetical protein LQ352_003525 [Teloschistes flavicans]|nr:MAG: hypothetical protein LQ352_003525 [Teloschistes flavicans]
MVFFGANDACLPGSDSGQHIPLDIYRQNLIKICQHPTVAAQKPRLILVTPPPIDEYSLEISDTAKGVAGKRRTAEHTKLYADACRQVGEDLGLVTLDLWSIFMEAAGYVPGRPLPGSKKTTPNAVLTRLLSDGLHFTPEAYQILFQSTMSVIKQEWPDQDPNGLGFVHPTWTIASKAQVPQPD